MTVATVRKIDVTWPVFRWECETCDAGETVPSTTTARSKRAASRAAADHTAREAHATLIFQLIRSYEPE